MAGSNEAGSRDAFLTQRPGAAGVPVILEAGCRRSSRAAPRACPQTCDRSIAPGREPGAGHRRGRRYGPRRALTSRTLRSACACVDNVPGALAQFERAVRAAIAAAVARIDRSPELRDEVRQMLWQRLFVGTTGQAPRIQSYAGRGPLAGWVGGRGAARGARPAPGARRGRRRPIPGATSCSRRRAPRGRLPAHPLQARVRGGRAGGAGGAARSRPAAAAADHRERAVARADRQHLQGQPVDGVPLDRSRPSRGAGGDRAEVCDKLGVPRGEFLSLAGLLVSRIDLSISRVLETSPSEPRSRLVERARLSASM